MRAVLVHAFGPPEVLRVERVPDPPIGAGEVLVDVMASGVHYVETQRRAGLLPGAGGLPYTPGREVGGVVRQAGPGVDPALVGRRVVGNTAGTGGYAERAAVPVGSLHLLPDGLAVEDAVTLLGQGRTALAVLRAARVGDGDAVLVEAAAGGVGSLLLQLARAAGARTVIGAARGERKLALVRELGADAAVDYGRAGWGAAVRAAAGAGGVTVVLDCVGGAIGRAALELLADGGRFVIYGMASGAITEVTGAEVFRRGLTLVGGGGAGPGRQPEQLWRLEAEALAEAAAGRLRPVIGQRVPLAEAASAHAAIEARQTIGKTLLVP
jgi:NADPH:quinone reductase